MFSIPVLHILYLEGFSTSDVMCSVAKNNKLRQNCNQKSLKRCTESSCGQTISGWGQSQRISIGLKK